MDRREAFGGPSRWGSCPFDTLSASLQSVDTVRTLHHTIVGLRTALEEAKLEISRLRSQLAAQSDIKDSAKIKERVIETVRVESQQRKVSQKAPIASTSRKHAPQPIVHTIEEEYYEEEEGHEEYEEELKEERQAEKQQEGQEDEGGENKAKQTQREIDKPEEEQQAIYQQQEEESITQEEEKEESQEVEAQQELKFQGVVEKIIPIEVIIKEGQEQKIQKEIKADETTFQAIEQIIPFEALIKDDQEQDTKSGIKRGEIKFQSQEEPDETVTIEDEEEFEEGEEKREYSIERHKIIKKTDIFEKVETIQHLELPESIQTKTISAKASSSSKDDWSNRIKVVPRVTVTHRKNMSSKIDVKIKLRSNVKDQGSSNETTSSGSQASSARSAKDETTSSKGSGESSSRSSSDKPEEPKVTTEPTDELKDDGQIEKLDHSASGSDNSVFYDDKNQQEAANAASGAKSKIRVEDSKEEVDDIELIFSSDENRDPIQEDLVSISDFDPWKSVRPESSTPVLVKYSSFFTDPSVLIDPLETKKISSSTSHEPFYMRSTTQQKSRESSDSTKSSSLEHETSDEQKDEVKPLGRDESLDFFDQKDSSFNRKWTNYNVIVETDISKCGITEETTFEMYRRNTCPNPPAYRPLAQTTSATRHVPTVGSKYSRRTGQVTPTQSPRSGKGGTKRSSAAQTVITALPEHWKSESQLTDSRFNAGGPCTLPSKFVPTIVTAGCHRHVARSTDRTQEARRVLLSDINFTSMVPELSRSADHLCPENGNQNANKPSNRYFKGSHLKTPDYALKGMTPSASMTSPGVSQWTVNENSFGTQTTQTVESWGKRGDSFDSCRSYSVESRYSGLDRSHRSRSVPSIRCAVCKIAHGIRTSESMHYTPRVTFQEPACKIRGSLPDLRHHCVCSKRYSGRSILTIHGDSGGSTESLLDEADTFVRKSMESAYIAEDLTAKKPNLRRMSENDIQRDYAPSKQSLPFLPKTEKCLKPGHLAKVISKNGRVVVGRVRYVGPLATIDKCGKLIDDLYVGVQLQSKCGDCDGTFQGRKFFECEPLQGLFVPFKKVVMAWSG